MASSVWVDLDRGGTEFSGQLIGPAANNTTAPPFTFLNDLTTGIGSAAAGSVSQMAAATEVTRATAAAFTTYVDAVIHGLTAGLGASADASNTAFGTSVLAANTTGHNNVGVGWLALNLNTTGQSNVAVGYAAMNNATTAIQSVAVGTSALAAMTVNPGGGNDNTAVGHSSMQSTTTGQMNSAFGLQSLYANVDGGYNTALGYQAMRNATSPSNSTVIGAQAWTNSTTAANVNAFGYFAGAYDTAAGSFYVDAFDRTNIAGGKAGAILYGVMSATASSQTLTANAKFSATYGISTDGRTVVDDTVTTGTLNLGGGPSITNTAAEVLEFGNAAFSKGVTVDLSTDATAYFKTRAGADTAIVKANQFNATGTVTFGSTNVTNATTGVAAGYKLARGTTALDGANPTTVATGLTSVVTFVAVLDRSTAVSTGTAFVTHDTPSGANVDCYGWTVAGTASAGTESFDWIAVGT